jgi:hypothetical protein
LGRRRHDDDDDDDDDDGGDDGGDDVSVGTPTETDAGAVDDGVDVDEEEDDDEKCVSPPRWTTA